MADYTVKLKDLIAAGYDLGMTAAEYPIFDESYRATLNAKIIAHYRFREIGMETPALFKHFLNTKLNEIMPYYNQLYLSAAISFNPLYSQDLTETLDRETDAQNSGSSSLTGSVTDNGKLIKSDMPQSLISAASIDASTYASEAQRSETDQENTSNTSSTGAATATENFTRRLFGNSGLKSNSELLQEYRRTFLNIDIMVINELNDCFMLVY